MTQAASHARLARCLAVFFTFRADPSQSTTLSYGDGSINATNCEACSSGPVPVASDTVTPTLVQVTNVNPPSDEVQVTLQGPSGQSGTLQVTWQGPSGASNIANQTEGPGGYTFYPPLDSSDLPTGEYSGVEATWMGASGTYSTSFDVLGIYEHTQYNTPAESQCGGGSGAAYLTSGPPSCPWSAVNLVQTFIAQAWENGSGITNNYGPCQEYLAGCSSPQGGNDNYFREVTTVTGSCGGSLSGTTVAAPIRKGPFECGDHVLIVGLGSGVGTVKTVADECPVCEGNSQLDNYSTSNACRLTSLGNFQTIRINR